MLQGPRKIDSMNFSLHYSLSIWEGIRAYVKANGKCEIFKLEEHAQRLLDSAKIIGMDLDYSLAQICQACKDVVAQNGNKDMYVRPIAYYDGDCETIYYGARKVALDIYAFPIPQLHGSEKPLKIMTSSYCRSYPNFQMQAKCSANYAIGQIALDDALPKGFDDVFLLDKEGYITEAAVANVFLVKGDIIMTPPNDGSILPGITRKCIAGILNNPDIMFTKYKKHPKLVEKKITRADLYTADCIFLTGTYAEVVKVGEVDGREIKGDDYYFNIIKNEYQNLVRGR
jgi:branched-chain amino acid aminotransferase